MSVDVFHHIKCPFRRAGYFTGVVSILGDTVTLIDTGIATSPEEAIFPFLKRMKRDPTEIENIVLTHGHGDHISGLPNLVQVSDPLIYVSELAEPRVRDHAAQMNLDSLRIAVIKHGDVLDLSQRHLEVLSTPGHSAGSICLFDRSRGVGISGDSIQGLGAERPLIFYSSIAYTNSMQRLSLKPLQTLLLGHPFPPFMEPIIEGTQVKVFLHHSIQAVEDLKRKVHRVLQYIRRPLQKEEICQKIPEARPPTIGPILEELLDERKIRRLGQDSDTLWLIR